MMIGRRADVIKTQGGFLISQIKQVGGRIFEKFLSDKKITEFNGAQGKILYVLWQSDSIPISELSKKTGLAKTTLTGMLDRMESADLIRRLYDRDDRRQILIVLTDKARRLKQGYDEVSDQMSEVYYQGFTEEEILRCEGYLKRILQNLTVREHG